VLRGFRGGVNVPRVFTGDSLVGLAYAPQWSLRLIGPILARRCLLGGLDIDRLEHRIGCPPCPAADGQALFDGSTQAGDAATHFQLAATITQWPLLSTN
jgi:hypothetical protein